MNAYISLRYVKLALQHNCAVKSATFAGGWIIAKPACSKAKAG